MNRAFFVAKREFLTNVKRRSFLFTAFGLPLLIIAAQIGVGYFVQAQSSSTGSLGSIGYVDLSDDQVLSQAVQKPPGFRAFKAQELAHAALMADEIGAYFLVPMDYVSRGIVHAYALKDIPRGIEQQMSAFLTDNLLADWSPARAERLKNPANLRMTTLDGEKEIEGEDSIIAAIFLPVIFAVLLMMSIFTTSGFLLQNVVEEKENRLVEILITSLTPTQILGGKIIGLGALGLVQIAVWALAGKIVLSQGANIVSGLADVTIPAPFLMWGTLYLLLGYVLFGSLLAGVGASVTSMQEGQQIAGVFSIIAAAPLFLSVSFFNNANGPIPVALSLFPLTAPVAMVMRLPFADVPRWQLGLSVTLMVLTTFLVVWAAAQAFRVGLLMYGKRFGLRSLWSVSRQGLDAAPEIESR
jgi:ABC-2 type transport system permease protein